jgi:hypothetical protein
VSEWFTLFEDNWLLGLLSLDLLLIVDYVLLVPIVLALYVALRRVSESWMAVATALYFVAIAAYFASNTAFEMLSLSDQYAAATTDAQRTMYLAAGQAMLATFEGTAFQVSYVLASLAGIIIGAVMQRSDIFSKVAAYALILGDVIGPGLYVPTIGIFLSVISVPVLWIWYVLIARRLIQLESGSQKKSSCISVEGGDDHRVVGRSTLGILERPYGLDRPHRPRVRRLGAVPVLQLGEKRELVRLRVPARRRLPPSGRRGREGPKGQLAARRATSRATPWPLESAKEVH